MTKKDYVLMALRWLESDWSAASWLIALIENYDVSDAMIDQLTDLIKEAVKSVTDVWLRDKMMKTIAILDKIKAMETKERAQEAVELKEIEKMLETM